MAGPAWAGRLGCRDAMKHRPCWFTGMGSSSFGVLLEPDENIVLGPLCKPVVRVFANFVRERRRCKDLRFRVAGVRCVETSRMRYDRS